MNRVPRVAYETLQLIVYNLCYQFIMPNRNVEGSQSCEVHVSSSLLSLQRELLYYGMI